LFLLSLPLAWGSTHVDVPTGGDSQLV
jgi:hypothetical protein